MSNIGTMIKNQRERLNMTQSEVAYRLGYTNAQFISNIERNISSLPPKKFAMVSRLLKLNLDDIIKAKADDMTSTLRAAVKGGNKKKRVS